MEGYDVVIIGSGAAGLSAALYCGRYRMKTLVIEGDDFGGETSKAGVIHNWPGIPPTDGLEIMLAMKKQAQNESAEFIGERVETISKEGECHRIKTNKNEYRADTIILAIGTKRRHLGLANEENLKGKGVHYCITCDGPLYGGKTIAVVGGGDASVKGVNLSAEYAEKIYLIVRGDRLKAEPVNVDEMNKLGDKIEVIYNTEISEIVGGDKLEKLILSKEHNGSTDLVLDGLFVEIGAIPNVELAKQIGVDMDEYEYIKVDNLMKTSIPGIYAAGDTVNFFGSFKQDVTASAMGAVAATSSYEYNRKHGDPCGVHAKVKSV